jgi:tetratricopeptide (TPR) repeat protein
VKGDLDRAFADWYQVIKFNDEAIKLNPKNAGAYTYRSTLYIRKGDYDRAIAGLDQAIKLDPNNALAYHGRGEAYEAKRDYARALANFEKALQLEPRAEVARRNVERLRLQLGR